MGGRDRALLLVESHRLLRSLRSVERRRQPPKEDLQLPSSGYRSAERSQIRPHGAAPPRLAGRRLALLQGEMRILLLHKNLTARDSFPEKTM
jgi:hypothetical protein